MQHKQAQSSHIYPHSHTANALSTHPYTHRRLPTYTLIVMDAHPDTLTCKHTLSHFYKHSLTQHSLHTRTHTQKSLTHTQTHTHMLSHTHTLASSGPVFSKVGGIRAHTLSHTCSCTRTGTFTQTQAHSHSYAHAHTHSHTHTLLHTCSYTHT